MMPEVQPVEYRLYANMGYFTMTWVIPVFMTIVGREQWWVAVALPAVLALLCFGRVGYMLHSNDKLARAPYGTSSGTGVKDEFDRALERLQRTAGTHKGRSWSLFPEDREYDWGEVAPWLFSGVICGAVSLFF
jgi:hypothetical protein